MTGEARAALGLEGLLAAREIVVCCGAGGVGKTSVAAAAALGAAARLPGKILVLTIDPARRLADALGVEAIGNVEHRVPDEALRAAGIEARGELWVAMLDTKRSWDDLVLRHAPDHDTAQRILDNRLYHDLTARFVQSHDYVAMERLFELHHEGRFDLVVVDTPPSRNALDLLDAPQRMAEFFGGRLLRWLTAPYRVGGRRGARLVDFASRPFYQVADRILGGQFLRDVGEFFVNFQSMYDGFVERARAVERLLHDRRTTFAVVTTLEAVPLREAERFCSELVSRDLDLGAMVLNRTLPSYLLDPAGDQAAQVLVDRADVLAAELATLAAEAPGGLPLADPTRDARVLRTVTGSYRDYAVEAKHEAELRAELARVPEVVASVPALEGDVTDLSGLARVAEHLFET